MVFSIGNIITLLVVLIILALYRQMDKNNRSLEKIKRYSDKIKEELDEYVDEKTVDVKNFAIELEVHHKTGKEILTRIQSLENQFDTRAGRVEEIYKKIDDYDKALKDLNSMTVKVQENLNRLHEESEFVDKVGKRIKDAGISVLQLEKSIGGIKKEFAKQNLKDLQTIRGAVARDTKEYVSKIHKDLEKSAEKVKELENAVLSFEARKDAMISDAVDVMSKNFDEQIYRAEQSGEKLQSEFSEQLDALLAVKKRDAEAVEDHLNDTNVRLSTAVKEKNEQLNMMIDEFTRNIKEIEDSYKEALEKAAARGISLEDDAFNSLKEDIEKKAALQREEFTGELQKTRDAFYKDFHAFQDEFTSYIKDSEEKYQTNSAKLHDFEETLGNKFLEMEKRISEYEEEVTYRFGRIEEIGSDIDALEKNLRSVMDRTVQRIEDDFSGYEKDLENRRDEYKLKFLSEMEEITTGLNGLESELNDLKTRAYENVSEKLKIFEDDFFADLQSRNASMEEKFLEWQKGMDQTLGNLAEENAQKRSAVEKKYNEEFRQRFEEFQAKIFQQHDRFEEKVSAFQRTIEERLKESDASIETTAGDIRKEILEVKESSSTFFTREFTDYKTGISSELKKSSREFENQLKEIEELLESREKDLLTTIETTQSDITVWQTKVLQQFQTAETEMQTHYGDLRKEVLDNITQIKTDFESQRDDLVLSTQEERTRLKNELKEIGDGVVNLEGELRKRTEDAFEKFNREFESFYFEIQKKNREMQTELEKRIKDFRTISQDTKEKSEQLQHKLYGKIEENYKVLAVNLQEIDKRQKGFIAQTKIFTRADSLKVSLQESIEDLKTELTRVEAQENGIRETERKFSAIKKLGDEVSVKLNRFMAEKRRIEEMEGDFKKLINISQAVDQKLLQVTGAHDDLQAIQIKIKNIADLEKETELRYERLEKKNQIIDATTESVDKNFQFLEELEGQVRSLKDVVSSIPEQIHDISNRIEPLSRNKKKADDAIEKLKTLDGLLKDLEARTEKMQKAREWLARTETRLEEVSKQAQEQVKLLGSILKEGGKSGAIDKGAPSMGTREVVTRLAHQGWSVKEIASATKLSRGEVELILELLPKK